MLIVMNHLQIFVHSHSILLQTSTFSQHILITLYIIFYLKNVIFNTSYKINARLIFINTTLSLSFSEDFRDSIVFSISIKSQQWKCFLLLNCFIFSPYNTYFLHQSHIWASEITLCFHDLTLQIHLKSNIMLPSLESA